MTKIPGLPRLPKARMTPRMPRPHDASMHYGQTNFGNFNAIGPGNGGRSASQEMLPSRHAMATLTGGDPAQRTMGMYAKATPSGAGAAKTYDSIMQMGLKGPKI